jgi:hypothetical protein
VPLGTLFGLRPYLDSGISRTYGTVGVGAAIRFYPDAVPDGTQNPNHHQQNFADGIKKVPAGVAGLRTLSPVRPIDGWCGRILAGFCFLN